MSFIEEINKNKTLVEQVNVLKEKIKTVAENKGIEVTLGVDTMDTVLDKIDALEVGGGSTEDSGGEYLVQVIDYDGTVLKSDHLNKGATFTLPDAPTNHERLLFQEWSSPVDITDNTITVENSDITIGAVYTTKSGLNEFDITLTRATGLSVTLNLDGTKDWGDGTSDDLTTHTYTDYGNYMITCNGTTMTTSSSSGLFGQSSSNKNYYCLNVRLSNITSISTYAFQYCYSLKSITIPNSVTNIFSYAFQYCCSLKSITIPNSGKLNSSYMFRYCYSLKSITITNSLTNLNTYAFQYCYSLENITIPNGSYIADNMFRYCYSLKSITIPNGVTYISDVAFRDCYSILKYDMTLVNVVPTLSNTNAFTDINKLAKIYVPDALYDEWIVATNWSTYADYIYKASEMPKGE